jgi:hypothetical protein
MTLKQAVENNLVQRSANGGYEDVAPAAGGTPGPKADEADDALSSVELFSPEAEATYSALIGPISQGNYDATLAAGTLAVTGGNLTDAEVVDQMSRKLAQAEGGSPGQHQHAASAAVALFSQQVAMTLEAAGVPKANHADLYAFTRSTDQGRNELLEALTQLTAARNPSAFAKLADKFFERASPSPAFLRSQGYTVRQLQGKGFEVERADGTFQPIDQLRFERPDRR